MWVRLCVGCALCLAWTLAAAAPPEERLADGLALLEQHRWAEARQFFADWLRRRPNDAEAHFHLGRVAFGQHDYDTAAARFEAAIALHAPHNKADFHLWLGRAYGRQAERAFVLKQPWLAGKARRQFETAVALDPQSVAARWALMEYYLKAPGFLGGSRDKARTEARAIERRDAAAGQAAWRLIAETEGPAG